MSNAPTVVPGLKEEVKEVSMDVSPQAGGARSTRRRRGKGTRRARTADVEEDQVGGATDVGVEKSDATAPVPTPAPVGRELAATNAPATMQMVGGGAPKVVIAPPKKKPAKLMLVPKHKAASAVVKKTFKAKRVRVVIDNTAKTQKRRRQVLGRIDGMSEVQLREAAVTAKLARSETVKKVPVTLLRQMLRDYQTLRGNLL
jgi:hypothetical protein